MFVLYFVCYLFKMLRLDVLRCCIWWNCFRVDSVAAGAGIGFCVGRGKIYLTRWKFEMVKLLADDVGLFLCLCVECLRHLSFFVMVS